MQPCYQVVFQEVVIQLLVVNCWCVGKFPELVNVVFKHFHNGGFHVLSVFTRNSNNSEELRSICESVTESVDRLLALFN